MPLVNFGDYVFIAHPIVGNSPAVQHLGDISLELCLYLETKLTELDLAEHGDPNAITGLKNFFDNPPMRALYSRGYNACKRAYQPPYLDKLGNLTPLGQDKAMLAKEIICELNEYQDNLAYEPLKWLEAQDIIVNATIPIRALRLLNVIQSAISKAEQLNAKDAMSLMIAEMDRRSGQTFEEFQRNNTIQNEDENGQTEQEEQNIETEQTTQIEQIRNKTTNTPIAPETTSKPQQNEMLLLNELELQSNMPDANIAAEIFNLNSGISEGYVPTAPFGQRARTDLKHLIKFGLVDMRAYVTPGRGRPKHVLRVSIPGQHVLRSLITKGIL